MVKIVRELPIHIIEGERFEIRQSNPNYLTHSFFKYPCKFIPEIPKWAIKKYAQKQKNIVVYDPFCGSGTTLLESIIHGHLAYGSEIDPFAKLLTKVKCTKLSSKKIKHLKSLRPSLIDSISSKNPANKKQPHINNISHWFSRKTIKELTNLLNFIKRISDQDEKDFLMICFASIIKKVSFCDSTSPKPYVSKRIIKIPAGVKEAFTDIFDSYLININNLSGLKNTGRFYISNGDALRCNIKKELDLAFTSPPYINAFDYSRTLRLENLWLNLKTEDDIKNDKPKYIGTENIICKNNEGFFEICKYSKTLNKKIYQLIRKDKKKAIVVCKFFYDMKSNLIDVNRHLKSKGLYGIVIGDSTIKGIIFPNAIILNEIANQLGYKKELMFSYIIKNPYIRIPRSGRGGLIKFDNVLILRRIR